MYTTSKILAFASGLAILAGFLGLLLSCPGLTAHLWGLVPGAEGHSPWAVQDAARDFFGWKYFFASVAGLTLSLLAMWLKKMDERLSHLLLSWQ
jgi:hypothetical protein